MDRQLTSESSRGHGDGEERLSRQPFPPHPGPLTSHSDPNFFSSAKVSRTPYPRYLSSASTPNLRERALDSLDEEPIPPVPKIPARIPPPLLPTSPSFSNLSRGCKVTIASPSTPNLQQHHHQPKSPAAALKAEEKELPPPPPTRPKLPFSPSVSSLSSHFFRRPGTAASPSTPNLSLYTTAASPSTPNFGSHQAKQSPFKKLSSRVKNLLHRKKEEEVEPKPLNISSPTDFRQLELDKDLNPVGVIATEYVEGSLSVPRFGGRR